MTQPLVIGNRPLRITDVASVARDRRSVTLADSVAGQVQAGRDRVDAITTTTYGVNTGFGHLSSIRIPPQDQDQLQLNLVRSHACAVGDPLPDDVVRGMLLLLANSLAKGYSGVRMVVIDRILTLLSSPAVPLVPSRGSVGASGDLAPLAHCALALIGEGVVRVGGVTMPAADAGVEPVALRSKEGLALLNGTHLMAACGALCCHDAQRLETAAVAAAAVSIEALLGSHRPFDARVHDARRQPGQIRVAATLRRLFDGSTIVESHANCARVQDPYSFRCVPQVLGAVADSFAHCRSVIERELDAVTDNPLIFEDGAVSAGNFHGQPLSLVLDFAAIAVAELAAFSERRSYTLLSPGPAGLPSFLAANPGLESGLMILQYTAASLVAELAVLAHPAGAHSIPTSAGMEDFNSMGATAALKLRASIDHAFRVVAIELVCATQGLEHHRPLRSGRGVEAVRERVRSVVPRVDRDRSTSGELEQLATALRSGLLDDLDGVT